jgi:tetratricopeptide (TPR) repeat protein
MTGGRRRTGHAVVALTAAAGLAVVAAAVGQAADAWKSRPAASPAPSPVTPPPVTPSPASTAPTSAWKPRHGGDPPPASAKPGQGGNVPPAVTQTRVLPAVAPASSPPVAPGGQSAAGWKPRGTRRDPAVVPAAAVEAGPALPPLPPPAAGRPALLPAAPAAAAEEELPPPRKEPPAPAATLTQQQLPQPRKLPPTPVSPLEKQALLGAARNAVRRGDFDEAVRRFSQYLDAEPGDETVRREFAGVLVQSGRLRTAVEQLRQLLAAKPDSTALRVLLADVYVIQKDYRAAAEQLEAALARTPDDLDIAARLARVYAFAQDRARADQIFRRNLADLKPNDPKAPRTLGPLLVDLERPAAALPFIRRALEREPNDLELLGTLVRAYALSGDRDKALETLTQMATIQPTVLPPRQALGEDLNGSSEFELAAQAFSQVLAADPSNPAALVGLARAQIGLFQLAQARQTLAGVRPGDEAGRRNFATALAEYHQAAGEYAEAEVIYKELLRRDPADDDTRLALAEFYSRALSGEFERAKAEYAKVTPGPRYARRVRLGIAEVLFAQRFFAQAADAYQQVLTADPNDGDTVASLVRTLSKGGDTLRAESLARGFLAGGERTESSVVAVRLALARALLEARRYLDAVNEAEQLLNRPRGRLPETYYILAKAAEGLGQPAKAKEALYAVTPPVLGASVRARLTLAALYAADFDDAGSAAQARAVLQADPGNIAALIRLLDAQVRSSRETADPKPSLTTVDAILAQSPSNIRALLGRARALAVAQEFKEAIAAYSRLLAVLPDFTVARRERARILYADHQFSAAASAYRQTPLPADPTFVSDIEGLAARSEKARQLLAPYIGAHLPPADLHAEAARIAATTDDPDVRRGLVGVLADHDARTANDKLNLLESRAKSLNGVRNYAAVPVYQDLIRAEPTNTEALFDLGQVYAGLVQTRNETQAYRQAINVDPLLRESRVAWNRAYAELDPQYRGGFSMFSEQGRNGLANITRLRYSNFAVLPIGDENETLQFGYTRVQYNPSDGSEELPGNIFTLAGSLKFDQWLLGFGTLNFEEYQDRLASKPTFDIGLQSDLGDYGHLRGSVFLENVVENSESLRQDVYRGGVQLGGDVTFTRFFSMLGNYRGAVYSDTNFLNELFLQANYLVSLPPRQLKLILNFQYLGYSEQSIFPFGGILGPDFIFGTVHPYFSPRAFSITTGYLEYKHYLGRDYFAHADTCYLIMRYGLGFDSSFVTYHDLEGAFNWDVSTRLSVGIDGRAYLSNVYNLGTLLAYMNIRFPVRYR